MESFFLLCARNREDGAFAAQSVWAAPRKKVNEQLEVRRLLEKIRKKDEHDELFNLNANFSPLTSSVAWTYESLPGVKIAHSKLYEITLSASRRSSLALLQQ